jgi:flagellin-like protein
MIHVCAKLPIQIKYPAEMHETNMKARAAFQKQRRGLSDLVATVLLVAITLIAGGALFGYVNGQAANSENQIGTANNSNLNFLHERFVVVDVAVVPGQTSAEIWVYNSGNLTLNLEQIVLYEGTKSNLYTVFDNQASSGSCGSAAFPGHGSSSYVFGSGGTGIAPESDPLQIILTLAPSCSLGFVAGTTYYVNVLGVYGNDVVYGSCDVATGCTK